MKSIVRYINESLSIPENSVEVKVSYILDYIKKYEKDKHGIYKLAEKMLDPYANDKFYQIVSFSDEDEEFDDLFDDIFDLAVNNVPDKNTKDFMSIDKKCWICIYKYKNDLYFIDCININAPKIYLIK